MTFELLLETTYLWLYVPIEDLDQPTQPCSLIRLLLAIQRIAAKALISLHYHPESHNRALPSNEEVVYSSLERRAGTGSTHASII